jgi:hypothetical protein
MFFVKLLFEFAANLWLDFYYFLFQFLFGLFLL